ncbi:MAG: hypothetical protein ACOX41_00650 [Anaerovoracaceae bacterium]
MAMTMMTDRINAGIFFMIRPVISVLPFYIKASAVLFRICFPAGILPLLSNQRYRQEKMTCKYAKKTA